MIKPKEISIVTMDGDTRRYVISRIPATPAREIVAQYPVSAIPKLGDYKVNEEMMLKMLSYTAAFNESGNEVPLTSKTLVDNHVPDWETLAKLEFEMIGYNTSFFASGKSSSFLEGIVQKAQALLIKTLTGLSEQSSAKNTPPPTN